MSRYGPTHVPEQPQLRHYVKRKDTGSFYVTSFFGSSEWSPEIAEAWGLDVKLYADMVAERLLKEEGIGCEVVSI